jgi:hypothetical protein
MTILDPIPGRAIHNDMQSPLRTNRQVLDMDKMRKDSPYTQSWRSTHISDMQSPLSEHREASVGFVDLRKRFMDTDQHVYPSVLPRLQA